MFTESSKNSAFPNISYQINKINWKRQENSMKFQAKDKEF